MHSVEIVGWGTDPDTKENYWTVKNSWGRDWGENGYGRIARGLSDFGLEDVVVAPIPWLERLDEPTIEVI